MFRGNFFIKIKFFNYLINFILDSADFKFFTNLRQKLLPNQRIF